MKLSKLATLRSLRAGAALLAALFVANALAADPKWKLHEDAVAEQAISFDSAGARLQGTLYLPAHGDRLPAIVVLHGAEAPTREYALYRHLSHNLPAIGFAVLVFDRRGSGASGGTLDGTDYEQLADDGIAGLEAIARNPRIDAHHIGFWGLSQGGWLAVLAASRTHAAAFAISVSAPMVTASEQMRFAVSNLLALRGRSQADIDAALDARAKWEGFLRGTSSRDVAVEALDRAGHAPWFGDSFLPRSSDLPATPQASSWRKEMDLDPRQAVRRARVPLLFIYGGADPWIPVQQSVQALAQLAEDEARSDIEVHVVPDADHTMAINPNETMSFDKAAILGEHPQAPSYFYLLASWLSRRTERP